MLTSHHATVRQLLARYATARLAQEEKPTPEHRAELTAASSALCAATGCARLDEALAAADRIVQQHATPCTASVEHPCQV
ncbi:DUF5133 domain-containing protein [Streptomyces sp. Ru73]|uniref:DUF5133 domain-containing protein n=1 Tax=Streptomyces sp. Ru73 TaxID=2080748 RepID=UPI0015E3C131|nr:DUF5133 domain-containing protein [Streptomyces sp. Ru73]